MTMVAAQRSLAGQGRLHRRPSLRVRRRVDLQGVADRVGTYYAAKRREREPSARATSDAVWMPILMALWVANRKVYGAHKLWKAARRAGHDIGRDQVARLMRQLGIQGISRRRKRVFTTVADPGRGAGPELETWPGSTGSTNTACTGTAATHRQQSSNQRSTLTTRPPQPGLENQTPESPSDPGRLIIALSGPARWDVGRFGVQSSLAFLSSL